MFRQRGPPPVSPTRPAPKFLDDEFEGYNDGTDYFKPHYLHDYQAEEEIDDSIGDEEASQAAAVPPVDLMASRAFSTSFKGLLSSSDDEDDWIEEDEARFAEEAAATASEQQRATSHLHSTQEQFLESSNIFPGSLSAQALRKSPAMAQSAPAGCTRVLDCVPREYCSVFPFLYFNRVQSVIVDSVLTTNVSIVVSAPTASGKTVVFELAIIKSLVEGFHTAVYLAPIKALCHERFYDWSTKFPRLKCFELTGDTEFVPQQELLRADIILTTPEKWDSMTRKWNDGLTKLVSKVGLLLVDEVHFLDDQRGPTLEAVVSRMRAIQSQDSLRAEPISKLRIVALSASVPNVEDVSEWLGAPKDTGTFAFDHTHRPVKVDIHVIGYKEASSAFMFDRNLSYKLFSVITQYSNNRQSLVFCQSRASCSQTAKTLATDASGRFCLPSSKEAIDQALAQIKDPELSNAVSNGIAFHHAGLAASDRDTVEKLFLAGHVRVLLATSTLAQGVNLPAHLVVIKGTSFYNAETRAYTEYTSTTVEQMIGRAGRPQFDTSAVAVIMTENAKRNDWDTTIGGKRPVESQLLQSLAEHLNAEVSLKTITNVDLALQWLKSTYLWVRVRKNPKHYGLQMSNASVSQVENFLTQLCKRHLTELKQHGMIIASNQQQLSSSELGRSMAHYCVLFKTMITFEQLLPESTTEVILRVLSEAEEFSDHAARRNEKKELKELGKKCRFPVSKFSERADKVCCLLQCLLGGIAPNDWSLKAEMTRLGSKASRVLRCMIEFLASKKWLFPLVGALKLSQAVEAEMWDDSPAILRQVPGIGEKMGEHLIQANVTTFQKALALGPRELERIVARHAPFGDSIINWINSNPIFEIDVHPSSVNKTQYSISLRPAGGKLLTKMSNRNRPKCAIVVGVQNQLLHFGNFYPRITSDGAVSAHSIIVDIKSITTVPQNSQVSQILEVFIVHSEVVGFDSKQQLSLATNLMQPSHAFVDTTPRPAQSLPPKPATAKGKRTSGKKSSSQYGSSTPAHLTTSPPNIPPTPDPVAKIVTPNGSQESSLSVSSGSCNCSCVNKSKCPHICCKLGAKKEKPTAVQSLYINEETENFLRERELDAIIETGVFSQASNPSMVVSPPRPPPRPPIVPNSPRQAPIVASTPKRPILVTANTTVHEAPRAPAEPQARPLSPVAAKPITPTPRITQVTPVDKPKVASAPPTKPLWVVEDDDDNTIAAPSFAIVDKTRLRGQKRPAPTTVPGIDSPRTKKAKLIEQARHLVVGEPAYLDIVHQLMEMDDTEQ